MRCILLFLCAALFVRRVGYVLCVDPWWMLVEDAGGLVGSSGRNGARDDESLVPRPARRFRRGTARFILFWRLILP